MSEQAFWQESRQEFWQAFETELALLWLTDPVFCAVCGDQDCQR